MLGEKSGQLFLPLFPPEVSNPTVLRFCYSLHFNKRFFASEELFRNIFFQPHGARCHEADLALFVNARIFVGSPSTYGPFRFAGGWGVTVQFTACRPNVVLTPAFVYNLLCLLLCALSPAFFWIKCDGQVLRLIQKKRETSHPQKNIFFRRWNGARLFVRAIKYGIKLFRARRGVRPYRCSKTEASFKVFCCFPPDFFPCHNRMRETVFCHRKPRACVPAQHPGSATVASGGPLPVLFEVFCAVVFWGGGQ